MEARLWRRHNTHGAEHHEATMLGQLHIRVHVRTQKQPNATLSGAALEKERADTDEYFTVLYNIRLLK